MYVMLVEEDEWAKTHLINRLLFYDVSTLMKIGCTFFTLTLGDLHGANIFSIYIAGDAWNTATASTISKTHRG